MTKVVVHADPDLAELIPGYLANRARDVDALRAALGRGDLEAARIIGHSMKGSGGGYGFDGITEIGAAIEQGAKDSDVQAVIDAVSALADYLQGVEVVYD
jgi:hypothetical protein